MDPFARTLILAGSASNEIGLEVENGDAVSFDIRGSKSLGKTCFKSLRVSVVRRLRHAHS